MVGNGTTYWLYSGIVAVFGTLFGIVTRRVNHVSDHMDECRRQHGERLAGLEAHYKDLRSGQKRIEGKVDKIIERV